MRKTVIILVLLVFSRNSTIAQTCDINPDYLSPEDWTFVNQGFPVNNPNTVQPGTMSISGGEVVWNGIQDGGFETRYYLPMEEVLCENWQVDFDMTIDGGNSMDWWNFPVVSFTSSNQVPFNIWSGGVPVTSVHNAIAVYLSHTGAGTNHFIRVQLNANGTNSIGCAIPVTYPLNEVEDYAITLKRTSTTTGQLTVSYDQTTESCCFEIPPTLDGLSFLQHSNSPTGGSDCFLTASVSELCVQNCSFEVVCPGSLSISDLSGCVGEAFDFEYIFENDEADIESFAWEVENGFSSDMEAPSVGFPDEGEFGYTLTITTSSCCRYSASGIIVISDSSEPLEIETEISLCDGEVYQLDVADYPGWMIADAEGNQIELFTTETSGVYDFVFESGCSSEMVSIEVEVISPLDYFNLEDISICVGEEVLVFLEDWESIASESSVSVSNGDGLTVDYSGDGVVFSYDDAGEYSLTVSGSILNCLFEDSYIVTVSEPIESFVQNTFNICEGDIIELDFSDLPFEVLDEDGNVLTTANLTTGGNYLFTGQNGCSDFEEAVVVNETFINPPTLEYSRFICEGEDTVVIGFNSNLYEYEWESGSEQMSISITEPGQYEVSVLDETGVCSENFVFQVSTSPYSPEVIFDFPAVELCKEGQSTVNFPIQFGPYTFADTLIGYAYNATETESISYTYSDGCYTYLDTLFISVEPCLCPAWVPNVFTPDEDGLNDSFKPVLNCDVYDYQMTIYNRWGKEIFNSFDITTPWRGQSPNSDFYAHEGMYVYLIRYNQQLDGLKVPVKLQGMVTLIR